MPTTTTSLGGDRARRARSPRDLTGKTYARQQAEQAAKQEAATVDVSDIRRTEYLRGHADGYSKGLEHGWDALCAHLVAEGVLEPDEPAGDTGDE